MKTWEEKGEADYTLGSLSMKWENLTYILKKGPCMGIGEEAQSSLQADTRQRDNLSYERQCRQGPHRKNVPVEERADGHCCPGISSKPRPESDSSLWPLGSFLAHIGTEQRQQSTCLGKTLLIVETIEAETGSSPGGKHGLSRRKMFQECSKKPLCQSP